MMRRRNCSLTENLEPRLVLSPLSLTPRGGNDGQDNSSRNDAQDDVTVLVQDAFRVKSHDSVVQRPVEPVAITPAQEPVTDVVIGIFDQPDTRVVTDSSDEADTDAGTEPIDNADTRTVTDTDSDLQNELDVTDVVSIIRTDSDSDSKTDAEDGSNKDRTDGSSFADGNQLSVTKQPTSDRLLDSHQVQDASGHSSLAVDDQSGRAGNGTDDSSIYSASRFNAAENSSNSEFESSDVDSQSWLATLAESFASWFGFGESSSGETEVIANDGAPALAMAGGLSLVTFGRRGLSLKDHFDADLEGAGFGKADRRGAAWSERRKLRWFGFSARDQRRRQKVAAEESREPRPDLSEPELNDEFVMSLMNPVSPDAFQLSPMPGDGEPAGESEDSSLSLELVAAGAAGIGGAFVARNRSRKTDQHGGISEAIEFSGTTIVRRKQR